MIPSSDGQEDWWADRGLGWNQCTTFNCICVADKKQVKNQFQNLYKEALEQQLQSRVTGSIIHVELQNIPL